MYAIIKNGMDPVYRMGGKKAIKDLIILSRI